MALFTVTLDDSRANQYITLPNGNSAPIRLPECACCREIGHDPDGGMLMASVYLCSKCGPKGAARLNQAYTPFRPAVGDAECSTTGTA